MQDLGKINFPTHTTRILFCYLLSTKTLLTLPMCSLVLFLSLFSLSRYPDRFHFAKGTPIGPDYWSRQALFRAAKDLFAVDAAPRETAGGRGNRLRVLGSLRALPSPANGRSEDDWTPLFLRPTQIFFHSSPFPGRTYPCSFSRFNVNTKVRG